jgi:hypothetical protein
LNDFKLDKWIIDDQTLQFYSGAHPREMTVHVYQKTRMTIITAMIFKTVPIYKQHKYPQKHSKEAMLIQAC